jgi:hypothetical protein
LNPTGVHIPTRYLAIIVLNSLYKYTPLAWSACTLHGFVGLTAFFGHEMIDGEIATEKPPTSLQVATSIVYRTKLTFGLYKEQVNKQQPRVPVLVTVPFQILSISLEKWRPAMVA